MPYAFEFGLLDLTKGLVQNFYKASSEKQRKHAKKKNVLKHMQYVFPLFLCCLGWCLHMFCSANKWPVLSALTPPVGENRF